MSLPVISPQHSGANRRLASQPSPRSIASRLCSAYAMAVQPRLQQTLDTTILTNGTEQALPLVVQQAVLMQTVQQEITQWL